MKDSKKSAVNMGVYFGLVMGLVAGLLGMCLFPGIGCLLFQDAILLGIIIGLVVDVILALGFGAVNGLVYGLIMYSFIEKKAKEFAPMRDIFIAQKRLLYDGAANHQMGKESVGGWMFLLNDTLYFKSHQQNVQVHEFGIPLVNIKSVEGYKNFIYNTGLKVELLDGTVEKYTINNQKMWIQKIYEGRDRILQGRPNV